MRQGQKIVTEGSPLSTVKQQPFPYLKKRLDNSNQRHSGFRDAGPEKSKVRYGTKNREITLYNEIRFFIQHQNADRWSFTHTLQSGGSFLKKINSSSKIRKDTDIWQFHSPNFRKSKKFHKYLIPWLITYIYIILIMKHSLV